MRGLRFEERLLEAGYVARREELLAVEGALATRHLNGGARALLLEGPPGCGKTALAEATAAALGGPFVFSLLHSWSGDEDLFRGVDVAAAVAGDAEHVHQDGVLAVAARLSQQATQEAPVVVCLDELDKAPERVEALLLDWLQTGRVPVQPGEHLQTRLDRVLVFLTSNDQRPLGDALLRRCRRVAMRPLPADLTARLIAERAQVPQGVATLTWRLMRAVAEQEGTVLSLQEGVRCAGEIVACAESAHDVRLILAGWAARTEAGREAARKMDVSPLWGEVVRHRRSEA